MAMIFRELPLQGAFTVDLSIYSDERGSFVRTYCKDEFNRLDIDQEWVQMNHAITQKKGAIRGMHFQFAPFSEVKLIRCVNGIVFDVIVDLRKDSPTFLQYTGVELSAVNRRMIYIPQGFAHGFQALTDNVELIYHHSQRYTPEAEGGLIYSDPAINIKWPLAVTDTSRRDKNLPLIDLKTFKGV